MTDPGERHTPSTKVVYHPHHTTPNVNESLIECLEHMLDQARAGRVVGFYFIQLTPEKSTVRVSYHNPSRTTQGELFGSVFRYLVSDMTKD